MDNLWMQEQGTERVLGWLRTMNEKGWTRAGRDWLAMAGGDELYAIWLILCDQRCMRIVQVGIFDLADFRWADSYEAGYSPKEAVRECLEEDDMFGEMFASVY